MQNVVKCPKDKPVTNGKIGMDVCSPLVCPPGEGIERESSRTSGVCVSAARNADDCMQMALYNWKNGIEPDNMHMRVTTQLHMGAKLCT